jgi:hypothetical protein
MRGRDLIDTVADLLVDIVHHIGSKAETRVEEQLVEELKRVAGKNGLLYNLAEVALNHPEGVIKEVIYPVVSEQKLRDLVKEFKSTGPAYRKQVQTVMRNSWRSHHRRRHVNPYGSFLLDMTTRIPLDPIRIGPQPAG